MYTFLEYTNEQLPFDLSFPQSELYAKIQTKQNFGVDRFVIKEQNSIIGFFQTITYPLIKSKTSIYIPYGPVLTKTDPDLITEMTIFLQKLGVQKNAVFIRTDFSTQEQISLPKTYREIPGYAYKTAYHQPRGEWLLDITPTVDELLGAMHKKTRYNIKKSLKQDLETSFFSGKDLVPWADTFIALNQQNTSSHKTTTHSKSYFKSFFEFAGESSENFIAITRKEGHVLAINLFIVNNGLAFCPFGASNDLGKKLGAYYHIKWSSIQHMKDMGTTLFNWGGVSVGMHDDYLLGVTKFKTGFGGASFTHPPLRDIIIKPFWYNLYMFRKFLRK